MKFATVLFLFLFGAAISADPPAPTPLPAPTPKPPDSGVTIDAGKAVTVDLGKRCVIEVKTTAKKVTWKVPVEVDYVVLDGKRIACWALPGEYKLVAMVPAVDDVLSTEVVLTVTGARPPPLPPAPIDKLTADLQAAYDADAGATKKDDLGKLAEIMGTVVATAKAGGKVKVTKDLQDGVHQVTELVIPGKLAKVRTAIGAYLAMKLGTTSGPATDAFWATAAAEYAAVAAALGKVVR